jgi:hypothetical protein
MYEIVCIHYDAFEILIQGVKPSVSSSSNGSSSPGGKGMLNALSVIEI